MFIRRLLAVILILCCVPLVYMLIDDVKCTNVTSSNHFFKMWQADLDQIKANLPPQWNEIEKVTYKDSSERTKAWIENRPVGLIRTKKGGDHYLLVTLVDFSDKEKYGVIAQYELFESKTDNKIWELGRTFILEDYGKKENNKNPLTRFLSRLK